MTFMLMLKVNVLSCSLSSYEGKREHTDIRVSAKVYSRSLAHGGSSIG